MAGYQLTGTVKLVMDVVKFESGFSKREFVVTTTDDQYPQEIKFECVKDRCALLDDIKPGQRVTVSFDLRGNEYKGRYFVNLSRVSISDTRWIERFMTLLRSSTVNPSQLVFEITETAAMSEVDVTLTFIRRLKEMGCRFALDDFGAGFSSFYYLKRFEVDYLKIDGGFVRDLATDEGNRIFVKALNDVARGLKKQVIAEWVESPEVLKVLIDMGAEYGQGYLFKQPEPLVDSAAAISLGGLRSQVA